MKTLRLVVDTNILISSIFGGNPKKIVDLWKSGKIKFVVSDEIVNEYLEVLKRFEFSNDIYVEFLDLLSNVTATIRVNPHRRFDVVIEDPADNKFLECAVEGKVDFIISGDKHLKNLSEFMGIQIITPASLLRKV